MPSWPPACRPKAPDPQPDLHIRGDREVRYERVAQAMAAAQRAVYLGLVS